MAEMTEAASVGTAAGKARMRALIVPREHGAWGLMLVPLLTGVAAGLASAQQFWPLPLFVAAALFLFWLRTPVESLLGSGPMTAFFRERPFCRYGVEKLRFQTLPHRLELLRSSCSIE